MQRLRHIHSDADIHCDYESSESMSQTRARPAIRLEASLSFISTTSMLPGSVSGPASPLLGTVAADSIRDGCCSCAAVASPISLFQTRDLNVEASQQQRSLQSLKASHSRAVSGSRSAHSFSHHCSQPQHVLHQHHQPTPSSSSISPPVNTDYRPLTEFPHNHPRHIFATRASSDALDVLESGATVLTVPSDPKPYGKGADDEPTACSQRVMSMTVSPAPRHAVTLSDDFEGDFSIPVSVGAEHLDEEPPRYRGTHSASRLRGYEGTVFDSEEKKDEDFGDEKCVRSATPPPRRAFLLSRQHSSADMGSDVGAVEARLPLYVAEEAQSCSLAALPAANSNADATRLSTILVIDKDDEEEDKFPLTHQKPAGVMAARTQNESLVAVNAGCAEGTAVSPRRSAGRSISGVVVEKKMNIHHGVDTTACCTIASAGMSLRSQSDCRQSGSDSMMSPFPRPVSQTTQPAATLKRVSPAHAREDEYELDSVCPARDGAGSVTQQQHEEENSDEASKDANVPVRTTASCTTENLDSITMHPSTLPLCSIVEPHLQMTVPISAQPGGLAEAPPATVDSDPATVTPLNSLMMVNSISGSSLTVATTAASSLWLVSGSTPTPLRRLRNRERETSPISDAQDKGEGHVTMGIDAAQAAAGRPLEVAAEGARAEAANPRLPTHELHRNIDESVVTAGECIEAHLPISGSGDAHHHCRTSFPQYATVRHAATPAVSAPSFSPEPARPQVVAPSSSSLPLAARTVVSVSAPVDPLSVKKDDIVESAVPRSPPGQGTATIPGGYSTATPSPSVTAATPHSPVETAPWMSSPSSALSVRVSEEVRDLVKRAQAEVCRTRESLLSTLRSHRASFHPPEDSPTPVYTPSAAASAHLAQSTAEVSTTKGASSSAPPTPTRSLILPTHTPTAEGLCTPPSATLMTIPASAARGSEERRSAAIALRPHLRAAADAILRRLQGYDARDHGVLPMETIMRVAYFVIARRQMPATTWSLRTADGAMASTPMRASMLTSGGLATCASEKMHLTSPRGGDGHAALMARTPLDGQRSRLEGGDSDQRTVTVPRHAIGTSFPQRLFVKADETTPSVGRNITAFSSTRPLDRTQPRGSGALEANVDEEDEPENLQCRGRPTTCVSPSRTLERVMHLQQLRAEEGLYLEFYLTVLEVFKLVFGERYACHHLGATNASRHDCNLDLTQPAKKRRRTTDGMISGAEEYLDPAGVRTEVSLAGHAQLSVVNEFDNVTGPLETLFPRLRQQYALIQREKRHTARTATVALTANMDDSLETVEATDNFPCREATTATVGLAHRPPPLDVLVYYRTFVKSLMDL